MTGPSFSPKAAPLSLTEVAALTGATLVATACGGSLIGNIAALDRAGPGDLTFIDGVGYADQLRRTRASACLTSTRFEKQVPAGVAVLRSREPYRAFVTVARKLFPDALRPPPLFGASAVSPQAHVHATARLETGVTIDPGAVIGPDAEIGSGTRIAPNVVVGPGVRIGRDCNIGAGTSITHALVGDRVIIHPGCRIGQDGFGFLMGQPVT